MRIYDMEKNITDRDILINKLDLLSMLDIKLVEFMICHNNKPVHRADKQYLQISNTISDNFKLIGLPAYHKHGPVKIKITEV